MSKVCVLLADGFEDIEAMTLIDVLRRAEVDLTTLGVAGSKVTSAHGVSVEADALLTENMDEPWDMVILPGGLPGAHNLRDSDPVQTLIKGQVHGDRKVAAICAAPIALGKAGLLAGKSATSYPGFEAELTGAALSTERVVQDGNITTSRGPGTAMEFALHLVGQLVGPEKADQLRAGMLV